MKYIKPHLIIFCLILALLCLSGSSSKKTVTIAIGEWPPFFSQDLEDGGLSTKLIKDVFAISNIDVKFGWFPWKRSLNYAINGQWDASAGWSATPEREKSLIFSDPIIDGSIVFFYLKSMPFDWETISDLKGHKIGAVIGFNYSKEFIKHEQNGKLTVERVNSEEQNLQKLLAGHIDLFISNKAVCQALIQKTLSNADQEKITTHPKVFHENHLSIAFSKKLKSNTELVNTFNRDLEKYKKRAQ